MTDSYVDRIAGHLGSLFYDQAPPAVRERVRTALLYNLSMALGGHGANGHLDALCRIHDARGEIAVIGADARRSPADAAFLNAALITAHRTSRNE